MGPHPEREIAHHNPRGASDAIALALTKFLRLLADTFFAGRYGHRAVVLETVAAVPGMVGGMMNHQKACASCATTRVGSKPCSTKPKTSACI